MMLPGRMRRPCRHHQTPPWRETLRSGLPTLLPDQSFPRRVPTPCRNHRVLALRRDCVGATAGAAKPPPSDDGAHVATTKRHDHVGRSGRAFRPSCTSARTGPIELERHEPSKLGSTRAPRVKHTRIDKHHRSRAELAPLPGVWSRLPALLRDQSFRRPSPTPCGNHRVLALRRDCVGATAVATKPPPSDDGAHATTIKRRDGVERSGRACRPSCTSARTGPIELERHEPSKLGSTRAPRAKHTRIDKRHRSRAELAPLPGVWSGLPALLRDQSCCLSRSPLPQAPARGGCARATAAGEAGGEQVTAGRGFPVEHFSGAEHAR